MSALRRPDDDMVRWAAQAVTFYRPQYWGVESVEQLNEWVTANPTAYWDKLLDDIAACGLDYVELCYFPGDWVSLRTAYETPEGVRSALTSRGLQLAGSYQGGGHSLEQVITGGADEHDFVELVAEHAEFVRLCGGTTVLTGPPRRFQLTGSYAADVDQEILDRLSEILDACGRAASDNGVRFAIHTEAYSCVCRPDEVDRVMRATDPSLVRLCVDTGHVVLDQADPVELVRAHGARVSNMHWKDCVGPLDTLPPDGQVTHEMVMEKFRRPGSGLVDWSRLVEALREIDFSGFAAPEIDLAADPIGDTRAVLALFDDELAGRLR